jgi:C4-type Zn-finger protein
MYCPECAPKMAEVTVSRRRRPRVVVVAVNSVDEIEGCIAELLGVSTEGGNA